jgi:hypothetical protein
MNYAPPSFGEHSKPRSPFDWVQGERGLECLTDFSRFKATETGKSADEYTFTRPEE